MFTNAGMNQFKDYFLGNKVAPNKRIADTQKCLRVSGKHNDLEEVGLDTYHHTMFEMLGNWSFGDYFKKEAIAWSWELLTEVFKLPKERLYVTVFEGDAKENLPADQEARNYWKQVLPESNILNGSKKDNFWEMGDTGPCGPCTEIHIDLRTDEEIAKTPGKDLVNNDHPQVVEIWNNVFIEFNRMANGSLQPLPDKHVDTGMGFERLCMAIQGKKSNYDTDVFMPIISFIEQKSGIAYKGTMEKSDVAMRVLADHIRAISFTIADGQLPGNAKAGYVIRRILRRAVRYYFNFLGFKEPFLHTLVPILAADFKDVFPELFAQQDFVAKVILEEESSFLRTLDNGLKRLSQIMEQSSHKVIAGKVAFELNDTFGFPLDLTSLIARENGFSVDEAGFQVEMEHQKERSRKAQEQEAGDWITLNETDKQTFVGYDELSATSKIWKFRKVKTSSQTQWQIALETSPFYGESGGQAGDKGKISASGITVKVVDTQKENDLILVMVQDPKVESLLETGLELSAQVDSTLRSATEGNHSATHLLHAALRNTLGTHVAQKGSLVNDHLLRFDFSHFAKTEEDSLLGIETQVNERIRQNIALDERRNVPIEKAKELGAMALFGEKYGEFVRVITFDPTYSVELCGGTHVPSTGQIGYFKIITETSVAAGVRRIEALTGQKAIDYVRQQEAVLQEVKELLNHPKEVAKSLNLVLEENQLLKKKLEAFENEQKNKLKEQLLTRLIANEGINALLAEVTVSNADMLRQLAFEVKAVTNNLAMVLAADIDGKPHIAIMFSENLTTEKQWNAGQMARELGKLIKGGGGGQAFFATAGGSDMSGLKNVLPKAKELLSLR